MYVLFIGVLIGFAVICIGGALLVARAEQASRIAARIASGAVVQDEPEDRRQQFVDTLDRVGTLVSSGKTSHSLKEQLAHAGFHGAGAAAAYIGAKVILFLVGLVLAGVASVLMELQLQAAVAVAIALSAFLFFLPNIVVRSHRRRRRDEIRRHLPDAIDLLEISISAGMGLDQAWNAVTTEIQSVSQTLADEMALTNLEIHLGASRAVALRHLSDRTGADELASLVAVILQSERFGTSMTDAMRTFASTMRESRSMRAQEEAETMAVKLIFPMIIFLFPAVVLVTAGPAGMSLIKAVAHK